MKLTPSEQIVYDYLKEHPRSTTAQIDEALGTSRASMRISYINQKARDERNENLIVNVGKLRNGRVLKSIKKPITRTVTEPIYLENGNVRLVSKEVVI